MKDFYNEASFNEALEQLSQPEVYGELMLASSPDAAAKIAESLEPVKKLVAMGAGAGSRFLKLLESEGPLENDYLTTAGLYVISRTQPPEAKDVLARLIVSGNFTGLNSEFSGRIFLTNAGLEVPTKDVTKVAFREAQKLQEK